MNWVTDEVPISDFWTMTFYDLKTYFIKKAIIHKEVCIS